MSIFKKITSITIGVVRVILKVIALPVVYAYKKIKRRLKAKTRVRNDFPGVYIVSNNEHTVKIGRSKHVYRRLRSYRGYQHDGRDIPVLLLLRCRDHRGLERKLH